MDMDTAAVIGVSTEQKLLQSPMNASMGAEGETAELPGCAGASLALDIISFDHIETITHTNGSPRPNLEPFLEPFIAESTPKTPKCSV
jgi:hypothetical protein